MSAGSLTGPSMELLANAHNQRGCGLEGRRVVVTRAISQRDEMARSLIDYGAVPVFYPCIKIIAPESINELDAALLKAADGAYEWLIVTSTNTVEAIARRASTLDINLGELKVAAIGPKSAASVRKLLGFEVDFIAGKYEAEALADELAVSPGQRVLLPQSERARPILVERLREKGAIVSAVVAYRTVIGEGGDDVPAMLASGQIEAITFTSTSTVDFFLTRIEVEGAKRADLEGVCLAAIGPVTADALREVSLSATVIPSRYTTPALVDAMQEHFLKTNNRDVDK